MKSVDDMYDELVAGETEKRNRKELMSSTFPRWRKWIIEEMPTVPIIIERFPALITLLFLELSILIS